MPDTQGLVIVEINDQTYLVFFLANVLGRERIPVYTAYSPMQFSTDTDALNFVKQVNSIQFS